MGRRLLARDLRDMAKRKRTEYYETGGGVVLNERDEVLLLERHVTRDEGLRHELRLPKGHIDPGESPAEAALREVCEESGYCGLTILAALEMESVTYEHRRRFVTRDEHYFLMRLTDPTRREPQVNPNSEEALFQPRWARDFDEAVALLTYEAEQNVARRAGAAWATLDDSSSARRG